MRSTFGPPDGRLPALQPGAIRSVSVNRTEEEYPGDIRPVRLRSGGIGRNGAEGPEDRALAERCLLGFNSGPPTILSAYNNNIQIFQTENDVVILHEMVHDARLVTLDGNGEGEERDDCSISSSMAHGNCAGRVAGAGRCHGAAGRFGYLDCPANPRRTP